MYSDEREGFLIETDEDIERGNNTLRETLQVKWFLIHMEENAIQDFY